MTKRGGIMWASGIVIVAALTAVGTKAPDMAVDWHNSHMDKRYVQSNIYEQQLDVRQLSDYRRDINDLKREKIRALEAEKPELANEIQLQIDQVEDERNDYKSMRGIQ